MNNIQPTLTFDNTEKAFKAKGDNELNQSRWLFRLMGNPLLVKLFSKLTIIALKAGIPIAPVIKSTIFKQFCGGESISESEMVIKKLSIQRVGSILDYSVEGKETDSDFENTKNEVIRIIELAKNNPSIPYTSLKLTGICRLGLLEKLNSYNDLNHEEQQELSKLETRLHCICKKAFENNVPIYFDAEESWIQDAIDTFAEKMMEIYNKHRAIILTTLQMYRWDRPDYLFRLIKKAREGNYFIGIKLVRGAYMEKENFRAKEKGYRSPIQTSKEKTDMDFDKAVDTCLENIDIVTLCAGTHNEKSSMHLTEKMKELKIPNDHKNIYFSQLFGMSDHITYNLADAGYNVTKYLPYGPVKSVIPYLIRRAEENTAISGQMSRELKLITQEHERRNQPKLLRA